MIRAASRPVDFELSADIYAEVAPDGRITPEQAAVSPGVTLLHGSDGFAYVQVSSVPGVAFGMVRVRPSARGHGVGTALLAAARERARSLDCAGMWGRVHEPDADSLRFATSRGFAEIGRDIEVLLTVTPTPWPPGIVELADQYLTGAYEVVAEATPEVALPQIAAAPPFEDWLAKERREAVAAFVALDGGDVVGYAALYRTGLTHRLENGLTAVRKSHRRRGLATAMKRAQVAWAAEHGYTEIITDMVEGNAGMRAVNARLGYVERPAWIIVEGPA